MVKEIAISQPILQASAFRDKTIAVSHRNSTKLEQQGIKEKAKPRPLLQQQITYLCQTSNSYAWCLRNLLLTGAQAIKRISRSTSSNKSKCKHLQGKKWSTKMLKSGPLGGKQAVRKYRSSRSPSNSAPQAFKPNSKTIELQETTIRLLRIKGTLSIATIPPSIRPASRPSPCKTTVKCSKAPQTKKLFHLYRHRK